MKKSMNLHEIKLNNVRLSFHSFDQKRIQKFQDQGEPKYFAHFILDKDTNKKEIEELQSIIADIIKKKFNHKISSKSHICLEDGDLSGKAYFENKFKIKAATTNEILVVNQKRIRLLKDEIAELFYEGCYVNAVIDLYYFNHTKGGEMILANLQAVQFCGDGEPFKKQLSDITIFDDLSNDEIPF